MTRILLLAFALITVGTVSASFLLALQRDFQPEQSGFFHRWLNFSWRFSIPAGIVSAGIFLFVYRQQIMR